MQSAKPKKKRSPARGLALWEYLQPLVEFYNLHLDGSEADKEKTRDYLRKHAPHVFKHASGAWASWKVKREEKRPRFYGTLSLFERNERKSWFESEHFQKFCREFREDIKYVLDRYIDGTLHGYDLQHLKRWLDRFQTTFAFRDRETGKTLSWGGELEEGKGTPWSKLLDLQRWEIVWGGGIVETGSVSAEYKLNIGELMAKIVFGVYTVLRERVRVIRCARKSCKNIYIPKPGAPTYGKAPKYCPACRSNRK